MAHSKTLAWQLGYNHAAAATTPEKIGFTFFRDLTKSPVGSFSHPEKQSVEYQEGVRSCFQEKGIALPKFLLWSNSVRDRQLSPEMAIAEFHAQNWKIESPDALRLMTLIQRAHQGFMTMRIVGGAASNELFYLGDDRTLRVVWDDGYRLDVQVQDAWEVAVYPGLSIKEFVQAVVEEFQQQSGLRLESVES